jgi:hypothetical protein
MGLNCIPFLKPAGELPELVKMLDEPLLGNCDGVHAPGPDVSRTTTMRFHPA